MSTSPEVDAVDQPRQRYASGEATHPDDVSNPHNTEDETATSWRERLFSGTSKLLLITGSILGVAAIVYALLLGGGFIIDVVTNPFVLGAVAVIAIFVVGAVVGAKRVWSTIRETDSARIHLPHGARDYLCEYVETGDDPAIRLYKGRKGLFRSMQYMTVADVSAEFPRLDAKGDRDGDDPAVVALPRTYTRTALTDRGVAVSVLTEGLRETPYASSVDFQFAPPSTAHEDDLRAANDTIQELRDEERSLRRQLGATMNRLNTMIQDSKQSREEIRSDIVSLYQDLREADRSSHGRSRSRNSESDPLGEPNPAIWNGGDDS